TTDVDAVDDETDRPCVYGDNAYGTGPFHECLEKADIDSRCKTQDPASIGELFAKDRFDIDLADDTVTCPAGVSVTITRYRRGGGVARFADACTSCSMRPQCTTAASGRTVSITPHEEALARARARQKDQRWRDDYRATRPKVERKIAHLMRRKHGGRRARVRGTTKVDADFRLLAAAINLARLAVLGAHSTSGKWVVAGA
ncbi:transposase, IS4 family protein, partial [mine drainage metagenome]